MKTNIKLGDELIPVRSSGLTAVIFKNLFNEDLIATIYSAKTNSNNFEMLELFAKLAFVMNWQANNTKDVSSKSKALTLDDYYDWVDSYDQKALFSEEFITQILNVWLNSSKGDIDAKNL